MVDFNNKLPFGHGRIVLSTDATRKFGRFVGSIETFARRTRAPCEALVRREL